VKVSPLAGDVSPNVGGYITSFKFVAGRSLEEVRSILGLKVGMLDRGAYLYELARLPTISEFNLRGYTQCPDGMPWAGGDWPAGRGVPQWEIAKGIRIDCRLLATISPGMLVALK
jgi:hypothetical protein